MPAVLYGRNRASLSLQVYEKDFEKIHREAGESALVNLVIEGDRERKVMIHEVARHYLGNEPIHVDFYEVDLTRKIHAHIPLHFTGAAPSVKELGGILVKNLSELEIEALPTDLPPFIEVNIESLKTFDDLLRVQDLILDEKLKVLQNPDEVIVSVQAPRTEEELAELTKPTAEAEKAAIEGMKAEEAVPSEQPPAPKEEEIKKETKEDETKTPRESK